MEGPAWVNFTIKDQRRQSTAVAFLKPAMEQTNLSVLTDAPVNRLVIENGRCVGVEYLHNGQPHVVRANNEVILSAGAIDTP
ncbi:GMC family oxidoreductase N-terminal domain-containing protein, partial [Staphylococcus sp. SIMBA_130]